MDKNVNSFFPTKTEFKFYLKDTKLIGKGSKIKSIILQNFPRRGYPPPFKEKNYFFPTKYLWLKMMYML